MGSFRSSPPPAAAGLALITITALVFANAVLAQSSDNGLYLFQIPSELVEVAPPDHGPGTYFDLYLNDTASLVEHAASNPRVHIVDEGDGVVRIRLSDDAGNPAPPDAAYVRPTFVVDFDEAPVAELVDGLHSRHGARPTVNEITDFVGRQIGTKTYRHGFRIASEVAVSLEGDCTEHSVLTAAVARAAGMPARLAFGVLVIAEGETLQTFGHAWAEVFDGRVWQVADATWPEQALPEADIYHIGLFTMENEGPGYAMELLNFSVVQPSRLALLAPESR